MLETRVHCKLVNLGNKICHNGNSEKKETRCHNGNSEKKETRYATMETLKSRKQEMPQWKL
jgi:hypothetical protein